MNVTHAPADYDCPFCALAAGRGNELVGTHHVVDRTEHTLTFVSPSRFGRNHGVLVIPTAHHENLYALPDELGTPLLRQHNEPAGNQDLWHFHVHVFPRWSGDGLYGASRERTDRDAMDDLADRLRAALSSRTPTGG